MANVPEEISRGVIDNGVDRFVSQVRVNGVSGSIPGVVVSGVVCNGVGGSAAKVMNDGVSVIANDVGESAAQNMTNGASESVSKIEVNGVGSGSVAFVTQVDNDHLLGYFNQEVRKDIARVREYRAIASGLRITVRRRRERIRRPEALGNCQDVIDTIRCHELRRSCCSKEWEDMFILYCRRAAAEDGSLAMEINRLCDGLTARIEDREYFIDELDTLADIFVPEKMAEFLKETQDKDRNRLMRLQILGREFELRAAEKNQFIKKLKGNVDF
ncbi:hypothetical protein Tco_0415923 [Tanacetum coccineum]